MAHPLKAHLKSPEAQEFRQEKSCLMSITNIDQQISIHTSSQMDPCEIRSVYHELNQARILSCSAAHNPSDRRGWNLIKAKPLKPLACTTFSHHFHSRTPREILTKFPHMSHKGLNLLTQIVYKTIWEGLIVN